MPGTPNDDDDTAAHHGGGPLTYWLAYRVWGIPGFVFVLLSVAAGALAQMAFSHAF